MLVQKIQMLFSLNFKQQQNSIILEIWLINQENPTSDFVVLGIGLR